MFERYTENARRALFFSRYEASELGHVEIRSEHLLVGLLRTTAGLGARLLGDRVSLHDIHREIEQRSALHEKVPTSVEIPFTHDTKQILQSAAEEADNLRHRHIGTEHLLLAMLRDEKSETAQMLIRRGVRYPAVRDEVVKLVPEGTSNHPASPGEIPALMNGLNSLLDRLATLTAGKTEVQPLLDEILERVRQLQDQLRQS
jgi:ATP-dependent Clp protease ATP-binding subunit ClpC